MYIVYHSCLLLMAIASASAGTFKSKNKIMDYVISRKHGVDDHRLLQKSISITPSLSKVTLSEEEAQELRSHGYSVELNKKLYPLMGVDKRLHKHEQRRLGEVDLPTSSHEYVPWGREAVLQDEDFWDNIFSTVTPSQPVKICVASTGVDLGHEDLPTAVADINGTNVKDIDEGWFEDLSSQGTHTVGTIAALGNNGKGIKGIIPNNWNNKLQIVIGKVGFGKGGEGSLFTQIEAIDNCVAAGAKVVALTVGAYCVTEQERDYFDDLYRKKDILIFSAAGTRGDDSKFYPAAFPSVISVMGIQKDKETGVLGYDVSNINDQIELAAPGTFIWSTIRNNTYEEWTGTGIAVAHAAGVAGILRGLFPECTNSQIRAVMAQTAADISGMTGCNQRFGHGLIQAKDAYDLLSLGNCGGDIGESEPVGGCDQLKNTVLESSCSSNSDCDDGDACTVDTCVAGICNYSYDCAACGLSALVTVDITTDLYSTESSWEILDGITDEQVWARDFSFGNCQEEYTATKCFPNGSYLFVMYDEGFDGMCCDYGNGGFNVYVDNELRVSGGKFKQVKATMFHIGDFSSKPSTTHSPVEAPTTTHKPTGTYDPTGLPTITAAPTPATNTCSSNSDCNDSDPCTVDTCTNKKCTHVADCSLSGCGYTEKVKIDINTDNHPEEIKWNVASYDTTEILWTSPTYKKMNSFRSDSKCFKIGRYVFSIFDSADDGMCCDYGIGNYTVSSNGKVYGFGNVFEDTKVHLFFVRESSEPSDVPSLTPSVSPTDEPSLTPSISPSDEPSSSPSNAPTKEPSASPSDLPSLTPSSSPTDVPSSSPSDTPTLKPSSSPSDVPTKEPSASPSDLPSLIPSSSPTDVPSRSPSDVPSLKPSSSPSDLPSLTPSSSPTDVPSSSPSSKPSDVPSSSPSSKPSSSPSDVPSLKPSKSPTDLPSLTPSNSPSDMPSILPSSVPSDIPSSSPSSKPSSSPSHAPSLKPSSSPSKLPSLTPSSFPSNKPSSLPSSPPSSSPSSSPSNKPSDIPSLSPSGVPSDVPSLKPSSSPSYIPSSSPSDLPSLKPSSSPSHMPSISPSDVPSTKPSSSPSLKPSSSPSDVPSTKPSSSPSLKPSSSPSDDPSSKPSISPSLSCALINEACKSNSPHKKDCCDGETCHTLTGKCEKFCATTGQWATSCGAKEASHVPVNCCSGLECEISGLEGTSETTKRCVEPEANVCSRLDSSQSSPPKEGYNLGYAKSCGATNAPNNRCCLGTACDHTGETSQYQKRCVDCAGVNDPAAECDPTTYGKIDNEYNEETTGVKKICCTGLVCGDGVCKNSNCGADNKNAKECGATYANKEKCCEKHVCVGKSCVRRALLACASNGMPAMECGVIWAPHQICCNPLECNTDTKRCG